MNKAIIGVALIALIAAITAVVLMSYRPTASTEFEDWKRTFGSSLTWTQAEQTYRRIIFQDNLQEIRKHNEDPTQTYQKGINHFSIYTDEEWTAMYLGSNMPSVKDVNVTMSVGGGIIDWQEKHECSPVKSQGNCAAGWAFAAVASIQSYWRMHYQQIYLSEQQLIDCSSSYGNQGCNGGNFVYALKYIKDNGGTDQKYYPYDQKTQTCKKKTGTHKIKNVETTIGCDAINEALMLRPVAVGVDARQWKSYKSGIFSNCGTEPNHAVLLVAISETNWKVKNSFSIIWGENGYMRLALGNTCGLCSVNAAWPV